MSITFEFSSLKKQHLCLLGPQVLLVKQRLETQYNNELQKAKNCMAVEIKELEVLLQGQSKEKLRLAQQRSDPAMFGLFMLPLGLYSQI